MIVSNILLAQEKKSDTTLIYQGKEIEVRAKHERDELHRAKTISAVKMNPLEAISSQGFVRALAREAGVFVREYGAFGALALGGVRGFGGERTIVVRDGVKLNNPANGFADFSMISLSDDDVSILRGGASAEYGADAMGGVITIDRKEISHPLLLECSSGIGSFGYLNYGGSVAVMTGGISFQGSTRSERAVNNYEYYSPVVQSMQTRTGADAEIISYKARMSGALSTAAKFFFDADAVAADRGVPGPDLGTAGHRAREYNNIVTLLGGGEMMIGSGTLRSTSFAKYAFSHYADSSLLINGKFLDEHYDVYSIGIHNEYSFGVGNSSVHSVLELARDWARAQIFFTSPDRSSIGASLSLVTPILFSSSRLSFEPALRFDAQSTLRGGTLSPKLSVAFEPLIDLPLVVRASVGKNFRSPTFNDFYWYQGGNPNLLPEHSISGEAGVSFETQALGSHSLRATLFASDTKNYIQWIPSGVIWRPRNISRVVSQGIEVEWTFLPMEEIILRSHFTHADVEDWTAPRSPLYENQLIYQPRNWGGATLSFTPVRYFTSAFDASVVGERWFPPEMKHRDRMPPYVLCSLESSSNITLTSQLSLILHCSLTNLFHKSYEVIANYPMPPREVRASFRLSYSL